MMNVKQWPHVLLDNKKLIHATLNIILVLLVINLLANSFGVFSNAFMCVIAVFTLLSILFINLPVTKTAKAILNKSPKTIFGILLVILSFIIIIFAVNAPLLWLTALPLFLLGIDFILRSHNKQRVELPLLTLTAFTYALVFLLIDKIPTLWYTSQQLSLSFSQTVSGLIGKQLVLGPSASGLWILITLFIFSLILFLFSRRHKKQFLLSLVGLLLAWFSYHIFRALYSFEAELDAVNSQYIMFIIGLIPILLYFITTKTQNINHIRPTLNKKNLKTWAKKIGVLTLVLLFLSTMLLVIFPAANTQHGNILFYQQNMLGDWNKPEYGRYGKEAYGMFGMLPQYAEASGYTTTTLNNSITQTSLNQADVLVIINLNQTLTTQEHNQIWNFVEQGGSLLVLGDHTDIGGTQDPLNNLLSPVGIQFRFDSGLPLGEHWQDSIHILHHQLGFDIQNENQIDISVGATLEIEGTPHLSTPAFPIVVGKHGYSDHGKHNNNNTKRANLGDYQRNPGEQLGDVILAAGAFYGKGRVLVFGDTSSFQNPALPYSTTFIRNAFNWLTSSRTQVINNLQIIISLFLLGAALLLILKKSTPELHGYFTVFLPIVLCIALILSSGINAMILQKKPIEDSLFLIDASHGERFSLEAYTSNAVTGLTLNLARNNYSSVILRDFSKEQIRKSQALILIAPTKHFTTDEQQFLKNYMNDGGLIILSTGFEDKEASQSLLNSYGFNIENVPLGPVPYVEEEPSKYQNEPRFVDSWPITFQTDQGIKTFYNVTIENNTYNLMAFKDVGQGGILLIADSQYLLDKNIESLYDYWPGNILFLKNILDELKAMEVLT